MNPSDVQPGVVLTGPKWAGPVHVHSVERVDAFIRIMGMMDPSTAVDDILTQSDIRHMDLEGGSLDCTGRPQRAFLAVEALRYMHSSDDILASLHASAMDSLPHQMEAVYNYALRWPRVRFMLAHGAGTGKTAMAGLILKDLRMHRGVRTALIVASGRRHDHWRRQLERFGEPLRDTWQEGTCVVSAARMDDLLPYLISSPPDMVIIDEAHTISAKLAAQLSKSDHVLLLTDTPASPRLRALLDMLEPGFLADPKMIQESIDAADNPLFLRRTADSIRGFGGSELFAPRRMETIRVDPTDVERVLYGAVSEYAKKYRGPGMEVLESMVSGVYALLGTLEDRRQALANTLDDVGAVIPRDDTEAEIKRLDRLVVMARRILDSDSERKMTSLRDALRRFDGSPVLVVTRSARTLRYLEEKIRSWGYGVCCMHEGVEDRDMAINALGNSASVMVATDVVDGVACSNMINYDIPWDPAQLDRRMRLLRRYGNTGITILNMLVDATPAGMVTARLLDALDDVVRRTGDDHIFDSVGSILDAKKFGDIMGAAATGDRDPAEVAGEVESDVEEWYHRYGVKDRLAARPMDLEALERMAEDSRPHKVVPEYTRDMFDRMLDILGGRVRPRPDGLDALDYIPPELHQIAAGMPDGYPKITFDVSVHADPVTFGHPVFEAALEWIRQNCRDDALRGAPFTDPDGVMDGYILFHMLEVRDRTGAVAGTKLVSHLVDANGGTVQYRHPSVLWDLQPGAEQMGETNIRMAQNRVAQSVFGMADKYRDEILMERRRQADVRERYGLASLDGLIRDLDGEIPRLHAMQDVTGAQDAARRRAIYDAHRQRLAHNIPQEQELSIPVPRLVCWVRVVPGTSSDQPKPAAMDACIKYERECGRLPVDVSGRSMGYDVISRDAHGRARYIAVRARDGPGGVSITPNEMRVARNTVSDYYVYVVYGDKRMARLADPGRTVPIHRGDIRHAISDDHIRANAEI